MKRRAGRTTPRVWLIDARDAVGTVVGGDLPAGVTAEVVGAGEGVVTARTAIPHGHKIALTAIARGAAVLKYGQVVGRATAAIAPGEHVHVHNMESLRGRGDLARRRR